MKRAVYVVEATPAEILAHLDRAHAEDKKAERSSTRSGCTAFVLFFSGAILLALEDTFESAVYVGAGSMAVAVVFLIFAILAERHNLDDARIATCRGLLKVLKTDLPPDRRVRLRVDYRDYAIGAFRVSKRGWFTGDQHSEYRHPWLSVAGRLADGAHFRLEVERRAERRDFWKKSGNKSKRRFKDRVRDHIAVEFRAPGRAGEPAGPPPLELEARRVGVTGDKVSAVLVTPRARRTSSAYLGPGDLATAERLLAALAWLHRGLRRE